MLRGSERQRVIATASLSNNRHAGAALNDHAQAGSHDGVIVN
jgi:hypothetical protein